MTQSGVLPSPPRVRRFIDGSGPADWYWIPLFLSLISDNAVPRIPDGVVASSADEIERGCRNDDDRPKVSVRRVRSALAHHWRSVTKSSRLHRAECAELNMRSRREVRAESKPRPEARAEIAGFDAYDGHTGVGCVRVGSCRTRRPLSRPPSPPVIHSFHLLFHRYRLHFVLTGETGAAMLRGGKRKRAERRVSDDRIGAYLR